MTSLTSNWLQNELAVKKKLPDLIKHCPCFVAGYAVSHKYPDGQGQVQFPLRIYNFIIFTTNIIEPQKAIRDAFMVLYSGKLNCISIKMQPELVLEAFRVLLKPCMGITDINLWDPDYVNNMLNFNHYYDIFTNRSLTIS